MILFNDKPAYKITATRITSTAKAGLYDCEGDEVWVPHKVCKYNAEDNTLVIEDWFYTKNF